MKLKAILGLVLILFLASTLTMTFSVQQVSSTRSFVVTSEPPAIEWNKTYGGTDIDATECVQQTSDGGYIIAGGTDSFGVIWDFWLVKTDASGNMEWNKTYGGIGDDRAYSVVQTSDGGYIVAGTTGSFGAGNWDFWLVKLASEVPVGGNIVPINKLELLIPYIGVISVILITITVVVKSKKQSPLHKFSIQ